MIPTPRTLRDHVAQLELLKRAAMDYWPEGRASVLADDESIEALQCAIDALLAAEGPQPDTDHSAGLIHQTIPDVAETEPRSNSELLDQLRKAHDALCEAVQRHLTLRRNRQFERRFLVPLIDGDLLISDALIAAIEFVKQVGSVSEVAGDSESEIESAPSR